MASSKVILWVSLTISECLGGHYWNYNLEDEHGPSGWSELAATCGGKSQSPVNIPRTGLPKVKDFSPLRLQHYDQAPEEAVLKNNGHTAKLSIKPFRDELTPIMSGGGLENEYKFAQAHFHWGADESKGSEHQKSRTSFPMEMHLVHYKANHSNILEALEEGAPDSLAVLAVFFSVQLASQVELHSMDLLGEALAKITEPHEETLVESFPLSSLLPEDLSGFYRYNGSLTTPTCNQIVKWTVLKKPVFMSLAQLLPFRNLLTAEREKLVDNFRPIQALNGRQILDVTTSDQDRSSSHKIVLPEPIKIAPRPPLLSDALIKAKEEMQKAMDSMQIVLDMMKETP